MTKQIKLGNQTYILSGSVFTIINYQKLFGSDIYKDLMSFINFDNVKINVNGKVDTSKIKIEDVDITKLMIILTQILYVLAQPNFNEEMSYDRFVQLIPADFLFNENSLEEIMESIVILIPKKNQNQKKVPVRKQ